MTNAKKVMKLMKKYFTYIVVIIPLVLSGLFIFSALAKLLYYQETIFVIKNIINLFVDYKISVVVYLVIIFSELFISILFLHDKFDNVK